MKVKQKKAPKSLFTKIKPIKVLQNHLLNNKDICKMKVSKLMNKGSATKLELTKKIQN
jgi:hypothetical protein